METALAEGDSRARVLLEAIRDAAAGARSEEDFKIRTEAALAVDRDALGITPRYETSYPSTVSVLGGGASDAVYGHLIIEYKRPGRLGTSQGLREASNELQKYIFAEASRYGDQSDDALRRIVGVGLDGRQIFFVRYRGPRRPAGEAVAFPAEQLTLFQVDRDSEPGFQRIGPSPVTEETVGLLLVYLRALRRRALTPEALAADFGPSGGIARMMVPRLVEQLTSGLGHPDDLPRIGTLFDEWDRIFGIVYGQELEAGSDRAATLAALYGIDGGDTGLKPLLFAVHTYYALLMKLLAAELASLQHGSMMASPLAGLPTLDDAALLARLRDVEDGGLFSRLEIRNFLEGDFFSWYLDAFDSEMAVSVRQLATTLSNYEPATGSLRPEATRDLLKKLYQYLIPPQLRHDLGEYYTPDWLAELALDEAGYDGAPNHRLLDPACGSGTFLVFAIRRARDWADENLVPPEEAVRTILQSIVGFDLNPLAVIAARTNYLLALGTLMRRVGAIEIPVYLCDSILTPAAQGPAETEQQQALFLDYELPSTVGKFAIPRAVVASGQLSQVATLLEDAVRDGLSGESFVSRVAQVVQLNAAEEASLEALHAKLAGLEANGKDGLWARLIKNGFAPVFAGKFDFVVGNPPWIRWGYLSADYRAATLSLWERYGLFALKGGMESRLGGGEKDFSMLFLYACADYYLQHGGTLGFLITQEVVKGKGAGRGFRRFRIGPEGPPLKVIKAHDLVTVQPFERASNKTAMLVLRKGEATSYPVPYTVWSRRKGIGSIPTDATLKQAIELTRTHSYEARPVGGEPLAAWQTVDPEAAKAIESVGGQSEYSARRGAGTDPYGVFWLDVLDVRTDGMLVVRNRHELGKSDVPRLEAAVIEPDLVFPAVRGSDIDRWAANPRIHVLVAQDPSTRAPYSAAMMQEKWPRTLRYLLQFRDALVSRKSKTVRDLMAKTEPWAMFGIGVYTFAPYKVVWKRMASDMVAAVVSDYHTRFGVRTVISTDTTAFIPTERADEAHYLAAVLNSTQIRDFIRSFSSAGRGFGAPSVIQHLGLKRFDGGNRLHMELSVVGAKLASALTEGDRVALAGLADELVDRLFAGPKPDGP